MATKFIFASAVYPKGLAKDLSSPGYEIKESDVRNLGSGFYAKILAPSGERASTFSGQIDIHPEGIPDYEKPAFKKYLKTAKKNAIK